MWKGGAVTPLTPDAALDVLGELHARLDSNFRSLQESRRALDTDAPVFALEHGLSATDLDALRSAVRHAVAQGFDHRYWRQNWLPFIVYAAESGYDYIGGEYWLSFEQSTPGWAQYGSRDRIRMWFRKFNTEYGGAVPKGAFAKNFPIIAWPITHAVLPVYLQRYLAQLLYEFRMGLTTSLLQNPEELGEHLAARTWGYTERFRIFCENTSLLGQVAAALLSGEGEESPYLLHSTLLRLVDGLEQERQAKFWLNRARQAANQVRARGFQPGVPRGTGTASHDRLPSPTDPRLVLRGGENGWQLFAELPELSTLSGRLPHVYEELRTKRARVEGADQTMVARGRLTAAGQKIRLTRLPNPEVPFIQLENGEPAVNALVRDQVEVSRGPIWLFKRRAPGSAVEVKGKLIHPDSTYLVIHDGDWSVPDLPWVESTALDVVDAEAVRLMVPERLTEEATAALVASGLSVISDAIIRPVGFAASAWDGEGAVEWLAGEPGLVGIRVQQIPSVLTLTLAGNRYTLDWPDGERELFLSLDDLPVGSHELRVTLTGAQEQALVEGSLQVTIRDPQARSEAAEAGEGIRLLASPARPTMSELWEPEAITIAGPEGLRVDLAVALRSETSAELASIRQQITLPLRPADWAGVAKKVRGDSRFSRYFDQAESIELSVSRAGVGYAVLAADRGFQPLRWQLLRDREGNRARLIDRTDSGATRIELFRVESPLAASFCDAGADIELPASGGLLRAVAGEGVEATATILLPTDPNELRGARRLVPDVPTGSKTPEEAMKLVRAYQLWADADLPGDVFAQFQRDVVLAAITRALVSLIAGGRWASVERDMANAGNLEDFLDDMQRVVGEAEEQKKLAKTIGMSLHAWLNPASLLTGFAEVAESAIRTSGIVNRPSAARFLLTLAGHPGQILQWEAGERGVLLQYVLNSPILLRAARFAVLGTRALKGAEEARRGF